MSATLTDVPACRWRLRRPRANAGHVVLHGRPRRELRRFA
jgi:hypothetical protein